MKHQPQSGQHTNGTSVSGESARYDDAPAHRSAGLVLAPTRLENIADEIEQDLRAEEAGYAGGILSAGVDGIKAAEAVGLSIAG